MRVTEQFAALLSMQEMDFLTPAALLKYFDLIREANALCSMLTSQVLQWPSKVPGSFMACSVDLGTRKQMPYEKIPVSFIVERSIKRHCFQPAAIVDSFILECHPTAEARLTV